MAEEKEIKVTEESLTKEIKRLHEEYHEKSEQLNGHERTEYTKKIVGLKAELSALLSEGAIPCPNEKCKDSVVHGMLKRPYFEDKDGEHPALYEVGCLTCELRSRASTAEKAVARWNSREYVK